MTPTTLKGPEEKIMMAGPEPILRVAAWFSLAHAGVWLLLFFRWVTFGAFDWSAYPFEEALADQPTRRSAGVPFLAPSKASVGCLRKNRACEVPDPLDAHQARS